MIIAPESGYQLGSKAVQGVATIADIGGWLFVVKMMRKRYIPNQICASNQQPYDQAFHTLGTEVCS